MPKLLVALLSNENINNISRKSSGSEWIWGDVVYS